MSSTTRSNLTVRPPFDLLLLRKGALDFGQRTAFTKNDPFASQLSEAWSGALVRALEGLPRFPWES